jgi:hypothetical protein
MQSDIELRYQTIEDAFSNSPKVLKEVQDRSTTLIVEWKQFFNRPNRNESIGRHLESPELLHRFLVPSST